MRKKKSPWEKKAMLLTAAFCILLFAILIVAACVLPDLAPWILAPFAVIGAWKFARVCYLWITTDPTAPAHEEEEFTYE